MPSRPVPTSAVAALDVGGTTIAAGLVDTSGSLVGPTLEVRSPADADAPDILTSFIDLIDRLASQATEHGHPLVAVAMCMPAPFDYVAGRSQMTHKFAALFDIDLRQPIEAATDLPTFFVNDADAFGIGAWVGAGSPTGRHGAITLGTGLGSAYILNGRALHDHPDLPPDGELWSVPYRDGVVEDYVSSTSLRTGYHRFGGRPGVPVADIARSARAGDGAALRTLNEYGHHLGAALEIGFGRFAPDALTIGGKIGGAWDLIAGAVHNRLASGSATEVGRFAIETSIDGGEALVGAALQARRALSSASKHDESIFE